MSDVVEADYFDGFGVVFDIAALDVFVGFLIVFVEVFGIKHAEFVFHDIQHIGGERGMIQQIAIRYRPTEIKGAVCVRLFEEQTCQIAPPRC